MKHTNDTLKVTSVIPITVSDSFVLTIEGSTSKQEGLLSSLLKGHFCLTDYRLCAMSPL